MLKSIVVFIPAPDYTQNICICIFHIPYKFLIYQFLKGQLKKLVSKKKKVLAPRSQKGSLGLKRAQWAFFSAIIIVPMATQVDTSTTERQP